MAYFVGSELGQTRDAGAEATRSYLWFNVVAFGHCRNAFGIGAASVLCFSFDSVTGPLNLSVRPLTSDIPFLGSFPPSARGRAW